MLKTLPRRPLLAGEEGVRLSLAGAQDKVAVKVSGSQISVRSAARPAPIILKPAHEHFGGLVFNEVLCLRLVSAAGTPSAKAEARSMEGIDYALVERYDRKLKQTPAGAEYERATAPNRRSPLFRTKKVEGRSRTAAPSVLFNLADGR